MKKKKLVLIKGKLSFKSSNKSYKRQKVCYICKKGFKTDKNDKNAFKLYHKVRDHCQYSGKYRGAAHDICNLRFKIPKGIPVVFHNSSTYEYHFIIKELAKELEGQFECLGENTEKYINFSVPVKKELDNDKKITYKINFFDSFRFMPGSLLNLVHNLSEGLHNKKCKKCKSCLEYISVEDNKLICNCIDCNKNYKLHFNKNLINRFANTYEFCNKENIHSWKRFDEKLLPNKEDFYSSLNMEGITDFDYRHAKKYIKNLI